MRENAARVGSTIQNEINERLVPVLSNIIDERLRFQELAQLVGNQTIFGEDVVKI
jgi:hypothetical protein